MSKYDQLFAKLTLPVHPAEGVTGATIQLIEGPLDDQEKARVSATPFFGGYAEDFLGDLGFESLTAEQGAATSIRKSK